MAITVYTYNDKVLKNVATNKWLKKPDVDPYNPLDLPPNTVRVRTSNGNVPTKGSSTSYETATLVTGTTDVYDVYKSGTSFYEFLRNSTNVVEVLGANTTGITNMGRMFDYCTSLTTVPLFNTSNVTDMSRMFISCSLLPSIPLFDTSSVTNMNAMFQNCTRLTTVPLFNTSNVTNMSSMLRACSITSVPLFNTSSVTNTNSMLYGCTNVQSGALALYQQASTQTTPPSNYGYMFTNCGSNTVTGAAELAQIPTSWGGTAS